MRLGVIGDTAHYRDAAGRLCVLTPVAAQLDRIAALFDEVVVCAPLHEGVPPASFSPYASEPSHFVALKPGGGRGWPTKLKLLSRSVGWWRATRRVARTADVLHFRSPSNVAGVGLLATWFMPRHRYAMFAGNWAGYEHEPLSYRAQRWLLRRPQFRGIVTVYGRASVDPGHVVEFFSPSFSAADWEAEDKTTNVKINRFRGLIKLEPINLVSVGALTPNKGHALVIDAVRLLIDRGWSAELEIVGGGPMEAELRDRAEAAGIGGQVTLVGHAPMNRVRDAFRRADISVTASATEGYPKVVLEAMVGGAVPVLTAFTTVAAVLADDSRGVVVERDPAAIADAIAALAADPAGLATMVERGRNFTETRTLEAFQQRLQELLEAKIGVPLQSRAPRRIMQVVDTLASGGRERLVVDLANAFAASGMSSHVCETRHAGVLGIELDSGVERVVLDRDRTIDVPAIVAFANYVRRNRIDVVHSHGRAVAQFVSVVKVIFRLPTLHVFHDHLGGVDGAVPAGRKLRLLTRLGVDGVVAVSRDLADFAVQQLGVTRDRVWVVPNGIRLDRFVDAVANDVWERRKRPDQGLALVSVANLREPKDYQTLLRAVATTTASVSLVVVGDQGGPSAAYSEHCRRLVTELGIGDRVTFLGSRSDVPEILAAADVGVFSSRHESGPLVVAEFAAAGLPFIATRTGDITEALGRHPGCEIVDVGDVAAFASAIDRMAALDADQRAALGAELRRAVEAQFSMRRMADDIAATYDTLIAREFG